MALPQHWLVKSGGRILGPMSADDVAKCLRSREIVPLDEVAVAFGRWHYIRDEKAFDSVVNELKRNKGSVDPTVTSTPSETETDITERVANFGPTESLTAGISEQLKERRPTRELMGVSSTSTSVYGFEGDKSFAEPSRRRRLNLMLIVSLVLVVGGITWKVLFAEKSRTQVGDPQTLLKRAQRFEAMGSDGEAIEAYKGLLNRASGYALGRVALGYRLLKVNQVMEAKDEFEESLKDPNPRVKADALVGLGVAALRNEDLELARTKFSEAVGLDELNAAAYANMAFVHLASGKPVEAAQETIKALDRGFIDPVTALALIEAEYLAAKEGLIKDGYKRSLETIESLLKAGMGFQQEALAYKIHILIESKESSDLEALATQLLDQDPRGTEDTVHSVRVFSERTSWDHILRYLKLSVGSVQAGPRLTAVLGYATFHTRDKLEGKKILEEAALRAPDDRLIRAVLSYVQALVGREDEAQAGLVMALEGGQFQLPLILKARSCQEKKDPICAEEKWKELLTLNDRLPVVYAGLASLYLNSIKSDDASVLIKKGLEVAPFYGPLLRLKDSNEGTKP